MIFLDSCAVEAIEKYMDMGIIRGVTTNPTMLSKHVHLPWREHCKALLHCQLPVSVEVTSETPSEIAQQAEEIVSWGSNAVVKIPIHSSKGFSCLPEIKRFNRRVNVTACMSAQQGLLAAYAGAAYVSLFCGRIANMGHDPELELRRLRSLIDKENLTTKIIAGSVREVANVTDWLLMGAHIVTVPPAILEKMIVHPGTKEVVQQFLTDAEKLK